MSSPFVRVKGVLCAFREESGAADFNEKLGGREWDLDFVGHVSILLLNAEKEKVAPLRGRIRLEDHVAILIQVALEERVRGEEFIKCPACFSVTFPVKEVCISVLIGTREGAEIDNVSLELLFFEKDSDHSGGGGGLGHG